MPLPHVVARFNRRVTNHILHPVVMLLPGFGTIVHTGRKSRREYRTPVKVFRDGDRFIVVLTYGPRTDWVRNVLASGGCVLETRGGSCVLTQPHIFRDDSRRAVPAPSRWVLRIIRVHDFLELTLDDGVSTQNLR